MLPPNQSRAGAPKIVRPIAKPRQTNAGRPRRPRALALAVIALCTVSTLAAAQSFGVLRTMLEQITIFGAPARDWFGGSIDDATAVARIGAGYARMIDAWRRCRPTAAAA